MTHLDECLTDNGIGSFYRSASKKGKLLSLFGFLINLWRAVRAFGKLFNWKQSLPPKHDELSYIEVHCNSLPRLGLTNEDAFPLSGIQHSMLVQNIYNHRPGVDVEQIIIYGHEDIDRSALRKAWATSITRHGILRSVFLIDECGSSRQCLLESVAIAWRDLNWVDVPEHLHKELLFDFLRSDRLAGFDLSLSPPIRLALIRTGGKSFIHVWTFHHIAMDGKGIVNLLREVFEQYDNGRRGLASRLEPVVPFQTYINWYCNEDFTNAEAFWRKLLKGQSAPTPLPGIRRGRVSLESVEDRGEMALSLSMRTSAGLRELAHSNEVTLNTVVLGAWALLLNRYSGQSDVLFGVIRAGRHGTTRGAEKIVGMCVNSVPFRVQLRNDTTLSVWLREIRRLWVEQRRYEHTPLWLIHGWSEIPRDRPIIETLVNFQDPSWDATLLATNEHWSTRQLAIVSQPSMPIVLDGYGGDKLKLVVLYDRSLFTDDSVGRILGQLRALFEAMLSNPLGRVADVTMISPSERKYLLDQVNLTGTQYPRTKCVHDIFGEVVDRNPDAVSLVFNGKEMTYVELEKKSNQLARFLIRRGVTKGNMIGVCTDRSFEMIVSLLGILKAGGVYVPLDPAYPAERLLFMLEDTQARIVLTQVKLLGNLPKTDAEFIAVDSAHAEIASESDGPVDCAVSATDLAYVIFTSGSTGRPKGACIPHRAIVRLVVNTNYVKLTPRDVLLQLNNFPNARTARHKLIRNPKSDKSFPFFEADR